MLCSWRDITIQALTHSAVVEYAGHGCRSWGPLWWEARSVKAKGPTLWLLLVLWWGQHYVSALMLPLLVLGWSQHYVSTVILPLLVLGWGQNYVYTLILNPISSVNRMAKSAAATVHTPLPKVGCGVAVSCWLRALFWLWVAGSMRRPWSSTGRPSCCVPRTPPPTPPSPTSTPSLATTPSLSTSSTRWLVHPTSVEVMTWTEFWMCVDSWLSPAAPIVEAEIKEGEKVIQSKHISVITLLKRPEASNTDCGTRWVLQLNKVDHSAHSHRCVKQVVLVVTGVLSRFPYWVLAQYK